MNARSSFDARLLARINTWFERSHRPQYFEVEAYQQWLERNGSELYEHFYAKYASFAGKRILDLGCGYGGKMAAYSEHGPEFVCGVDINTAVIAEAKKRLAGLTSKTAFAGADAAALPYCDSTFDLVISDDGFDHFKLPRQVLDEIIRVLKPGGIALISFVPYYSTECSHMTEYLRVPWHHVLFRGEAIKQALHLVEASRSASESAQSPLIRNAADGLFNNFVNHLSRLTLRRFKGLLVGRRGVKLVRLRQQSRDWARLFTYLPGLSELVTDAVFCVLVKDELSNIRLRDFACQIALNIGKDVRAINKRVAAILGSRRNSPNEHGAERYSK